MAIYTLITKKQLPETTCSRCKKVIKLQERYYSMRSPYEICINCFNPKTDKIKLMKQDPKFDFDLPEVKDGLRIHRKPHEECESCQG